MLHYPRPLCCRQITSANDKWPRPGDIGHGQSYHSLPMHIPKLTSGVWTCHIIHGLCTSLSGRRAWPSHIAFVLRTTANRCKTWATCLGLSVYISQPTSTVDFPHSCRSLHTMVIRRQTFAEYIHHGMLKLSVTCTHKSAYIGHVLPASSVACAHDVTP